MSDSSPEVVADTATTVAVDAQAPATTTTVSDAKPGADSSPEPQAGMLDAVKAALKPKEVSPTSTEPGSTVDAETPDSNAEVPPEESDELSAEELKAVSQKTQRRFQRLIAKTKAKDKELEALKPKAAEFEKIDKFVTDAGLTNQEVGFLLEVGALMKGGDPSKALERLLPVMQQLQQQVGEVLPADLQERVRLGYLTEADARELSKARATAQHSAARAERSEAARQEAAQRAEQQTAINRSITAAEKWESTKASKDPDWHLKRTEVAAKVKLAILEKGEKWFPSAEEIVTISDKALAEVNKIFKFRTPNPTEIKPVDAGGASTRTTPKPTSMLDVVRNAVAK